MPTPEEILAQRQARQQRFSSLFDQKLPQNARNYLAGSGGEYDPLIGPDGPITDPAAFGGGQFDDKMWLASVGEAMDAAESPDIVRQLQKQFMDDYTGAIGQSKIPGGDPMRNFTMGQAVNALAGERVNKFATKDLEDDTANSLLGEGPVTGGGGGAAVPRPGPVTLTPQQQKQQRDLTVAVEAGIMSADEAYKAGWLGPDWDTGTAVAPTPASQGLLR